MHHCKILQLAAKDSNNVAESYEYRRERSSAGEQI